MSERLKLPPFGKAVHATRDAMAAQGKAPDFVTVLYGDNCWDLAKQLDPVILVPAGEFETGKYDWSPVTDVAIELWWLGGEDAIALAIELARISAPIHVTLGDPARRHRRELTDFLWTPDCQPRHEGWSHELGADYERRFWLYQRCRAADLGLWKLSDDDRRQAAGG